MEDNEEEFDIYQAVGRTGSGADDTDPKSEQLEGEVGEQETHLFPPDVDPPIAIGGSPEERGTLEEELSS